MWAVLLIFRGGSNPNKYPTLNFIPSGESLCCSTGCGRVCVIPVFTGTYDK